MELLNDAMGRHEFMIYLEKEFSGKEQNVKPAEAFRDKLWWSRPDPWQQTATITTLITISTYILNNPDPDKRNKTK